MKPHVQFPLIKIQKRISAQFNIAAVYTFMLNQQKIGMLLKPANRKYKPYLLASLLFYVGLAVLLLSLSPRLMAQTPSEHVNKNKHAVHTENDRHAAHQAPPTDEEHKGHREHKEHNNHDANQGHNDHTEHSDHVEMSAAMAQKIGLQTQMVRAGELNISTTVYGNIVTDPASLSHIRARFDGVITQVNTNLGDKVKKGDTLARVESNESLKTYPITTPFSGMVIARHANEGELSKGQVLFSIADYSQVWAQLKIFPQQLGVVASKQTVQLSFADASMNSLINHILPAAEEQPYVLAYAKIDNNTGRWPVGAAIKANINIARVDVAMCVPKSAVQQYEGNDVVFVKKGQTYHAKPITLGRSDYNNVEVLAGLELGDIVVSNNSYLFKADLEKSGAAHVH